MSRMPSVGDTVDDVFRIEKELDHGNFGAVYQATDLLEHRTLALKVLKPGPHDEEELRQRFEREASLIYSLRHPHVVEVYYYGQTDKNLPYMAMEYLQGTDLRTLLQHHGGLAESLARRIAIESLAALHCAHAVGIIHRDLKPANIYLVNDGAKGHVKVLDFGFAKALESEQSQEITNAGTLVGTPAYMSPELVHKSDVGPAADLYAMGLILAEMLCGEKIVQIESIYDTIIFQGSEKPIKLPDELRNSQFSEVLERSIAKDLDHRYGTALEMIDALRELDLPDVGPFTDDVQLNRAPPEIGTANPDANTRPRSDGRPSMAAVEAAIESDVHRHVGAFGHDDPTVERPVHQDADFESGPQPVNRQPVKQRPMERQPVERHQTFEQRRGHAPEPEPDLEPRPVQEHTTMGAAERRPSSPPQRSSALRDIFVGLLVGGIVLTAILFVLTSV